MTSSDGHPLTSVLTNLDRLDSSLTRLLARIEIGTDRMLDDFADVGARLDDLLASQQSVIRQLRAGHVQIARQQHSRRSCS